jgi:hypothetical protein
VDEVGIGGKPVSPRLHLSMHKIVANQLWDDEPPQTRQTARRLLALGHERHDVPHMPGSVVAGEVWRVRREDIPFNRARFAEALDALPSSWGRLGASRPSGGRTAGSPHRGRTRRDGCGQAA